MEAVRTGSEEHPRFSWLGLVVSQVAVVLATELVVWWDVGLWWTVGCMAWATSYAVTRLHRPYRRPAVYLAVTYGTWLVGMVLERLLPRWLPALAG